MSEDQQQIMCPKCGEEIDVNNILYHQVEEKLRRKYQDDLAQEAGKYQAQLKSLNEDKKKFLKENRELN